MKYLSHPDQKLTDHIANIAVYDLLDAIFTVCAKFHDLAKVTDNFQQYIQNPEHNTALPHAPASAIVYLLQHIGENFRFSKEALFVFNAILSHHGKLKSFRNRDGNDILEFFTKEVPTAQIEEIYAKEDVVRYFSLQPIQIEHFRKLRRKNRALSFTINDFTIQKLLFSKLIFADKYEAIFKKAHQKKVNTCTRNELHKYKERYLAKDPVRDAVKEAILKRYNAKERIYTLTAPTGIGKTLTSLEFALKVKEEKALEKMIYILPFTSIIDQTYEIFDKIFPGVVTKHHYAVTFDVDTDQHNDYDRWKFILNSWNEPFIVSTLYQFFFALFSNKNSDNIKFQALQNSVIVLDEVQAIPFELWKAFKAILSILSEKLNATFVLMSATMPILTDSGKATELADKTNLFRLQNRYVLRYFKHNSLEELAQAIIKKYDEGKSVVCVVNTIKTSKLLYKKIKEKIESCYCLNSYMFYDDRKKVINALRDTNSSNVSHKILISTQVIEAGVDLDFDVGFREFAPVSSVIQTAGRVNREGKKKSAEIYIFDKITNVYDTMMMVESEKTLLHTLKQADIYEKDLLPVVESYFQALDENKGDSGILEDIQNFCFDCISKKNYDAFGLEQDHIKSVALGIDLKEKECAYFALGKDLNLFEKKREKEKIIRSFQSNILNIKEKDLHSLGFEIPFSNIFGSYYIDNLEGIYSPQSGFLIEEEKNGNLFD